ncbi:MAG: tetratricopeptide repeat protein [Pirellulales bacterium]
MDRKALSVCASLLVLVTLALSVGYHAWRERSVPPGTRPPRLLTESERAAAGPLGPWAEPTVVAAGLIEVATPPTTKKEPSAAAPAPATIKLSPGSPSAQGPPPRTANRSGPKPTMIEAVPTAPAARPPVVLRPVDGNAAPKSLANGQDSPFKFRDGASALANPLLPSHPSDDRVAPPRSVLVAPSIAPAITPTVPPTMPLVVPARPTAPTIADRSQQNEVKIATPETSPLPADVTPEVVAPEPAPAAIAKEAPQEAPDAKQPAAHKWVKKKRHGAQPPAGAKNEPTLAKRPDGGTPTLAQPEPTLATPQPTPAAEAVVKKNGAQKVAPVPVELAPTPAPVAAPPEQVAKDPAADPAADGDEPAVADAGGIPAMPLAESSEGHVLPDDQYTRLPWAETTVRSSELVAEMKRADERVLHGYDLASRGAVYAARAEFIVALKIIAQAYDNQEGTRRYSRAATAGLTAIKEASDFVRTSQTLREVEISSVLVAHSTPVLKDSDTSDMPPIAAARCYYTYAQEQLAAAVGQEVCGSMALYAMGKVAVMSSKPTGATIENTGQAMALYRAALIAYPKNFRAANELGVLLAQNGQYELARDLLIRSVVVSPQATTWKNLAAIHARIGEHQMAERAKQRAFAMQQQGRDLSSTPAVQWVDPAVFASTSSATDTLPVAPVPQAQTSAASKAGGKPAAPSSTPPVKVAKKPLADWLRPSPRQQ